MQSRTNTQEFSLDNEISREGNYNCKQTTSLSTGVAYVDNFHLGTTGPERQRPYHFENTGSSPITAVKQRLAWLVLGWVTVGRVAQLV